MAMNAPFGRILRDAREAKGIELNEAARRLRIRPDILRAIEANDFAHMPPRGYARNMVNAYARFLELNPSEITHAYLSEINSYQMGAADEDDMYEDVSRRARSSQRSRSEAGMAGRDRSYRSESGRQVYSDRMETRSSVGYADLRSTGQSGRGARPSAGGQPYTNFYSGNQGGSSILDMIKDKWMFIAGAIVIILLLVIVIKVVSCATAAPEEETAYVPITGVADTTKTEDGTEEETPAAPVETAPTSATFKYTVESGSTAYVQINQDGNNILDDDVSDSQSFDVTGTLTFMTDSPSKVKVMVNNEEVKLSENSIGLYECKVDFSKILADWNSQHVGSVAPASTATTTSSATSTESSSEEGSDESAQEEEGSEEESES